MADETLREFAASLGRVSDAVERDVKGIISKGAVNIKKQMRKDVKGHDHFLSKTGKPALGNSINYDLIDRGLGAEIGPPPGTLAGIAYFGSSRPGGATVPDPKGALDAEVPNVERFIADAMAGRLSRP